MSNIIKLRKGLDLPLEGAAEKKVLMEVNPDVVALKPTDFKGLVPKLLVKEGDSVKAGTALFADKMCPEIQFTSPVSGTVQSVIRGEKRKLLAVTVKADGKMEAEDFGKHKTETMSAQDIKTLLLKSGLWASIIQRPYGIVAKPDATPKAIFISGFNTAPNAASVSFSLEGQQKYLQAAVSALAKMTGAPVHVSLCAKSGKNSPLAGLNNVEYHYFEGKHPAGNVGIQIHHICPIRKGETVWTISPVMLASIGKLLLEGRVDMSRLVAITGPEAGAHAYVKATAGMAISDIAAYIPENNVRIISGDVLSGTNVGRDGYLGFQDTQISIIAEGDYYEMFGWMNPIRSKQFSASRSYFSWLCPKKKYNMDTNIHGGVRAFMFNNIYGDVLPMHIFPVYLCKACMTSDIDKMEKYGIYEVLPEDLATCEYVCPSKIEWQSYISAGIDLMLKEMA